MTGSAIGFMLFGILFLWGGLTTAILHYQKKDKEAGASGYSNEE